MKCIVTETSPERVNAHPVTNEDGTPHVYATMAEARAELRANGYSYNRANDRYYIKGTEYRAYIIREDSEEFTDAITTDTAEEPEQTTAERIAEQARDFHHDTIYSAITAEDIEQADAYTNEHLKLTVEVMDALGVFHVSDRMLVAIAQAMRAELDSIEAESATETHLPYAERVERKAYQRAELEAFLGEYVDAYDVDAIEDEATEYDPKTGAQLWTPEAVSDLMSICERHERIAPREWHITVNIDETAQDFTDVSADGAETAEQARELLRNAWNRRKPRRLHLAEDTARIIDVYSI